MEKSKLEQRYIDLLKKMGFKEFTDENYAEVYDYLCDIDGGLGNKETRTKEEDVELKTACDFLDRLDDLANSNETLDYDWINEQLNK